METKVQEFIDNVDAWIKQIRAEVTQITDVSGVVEENVDNTQHNYELIQELRDEMESMKREMNALKLLQLAQIREKFAQKTISESH